jgi:hypothetical protein
MRNLSGQGIALHVKKLYTVKNSAHPHRGYRRQQLRLREVKQELKQFVRPVSSPAFIHGIFFAQGDQPCNGLFPGQPGSCGERIFLIYLPEYI